MAYWGISLTFTMVSDSAIAFQELNGAVAKINDLVSQRTIGGQHATQFFLDQKDVQALGLGSHLHLYFFVFIFYVVLLFLRLYQFAIKKSLHSEGYSVNIQSRSTIHSLCSRSRWAPKPHFCSCSVLCEK